MEWEVDYENIFKNVKLKGEEVDKDEIKEWDLQIPLNIENLDFDRQKIPLV